MNALAAPPDARGSNNGSEMMTEDKVKSYTPAAGYHWLTPFYDFGVAILTREKVWRSSLLRHIAPAPTDVFLDVGAGTGNLAAAMAKAEMAGRYFGIDPDPAATAIAREKLRNSKFFAEFRVGYFSASAVSDWPRPSKATLCLVLHQVSDAEKARILGEIWHSLADDGELYVDDYGMQRTQLMRGLFRLTIQQLDGVRDTQPNADGMLPLMITEAGFVEVRELEQFRTVTGSISILAAKKTNVHKRA